MKNLLQSESECEHKRCNRSSFSTWHPLHPVGLPQRFERVGKSYEIEVELEILLLDGIYLLLISCGSHLDLILFIRRTFS